MDQLTFDINNSKTHNSRAVESPKMHFERTISPVASKTSFFAGQEVVDLNLELDLESHFARGGLEIFENTHFDDHQIKKLGKVKKPQLNLNLHQIESSANPCLSPYTPSTGSTFPAIFTPTVHGDFISSSDRDIINLSNQHPADTSLKSRNFTPHPSSKPSSGYNQTQNFSSFYNNFQSGFHHAPRTTSHDLEHQRNIRQNQRMQQHFFNSNLSLPSQNGAIQTNPRIQASVPLSGTPCGSLVNEEDFCAPNIKEFDDENDQINRTKKTFQSCTRLRTLSLRSIGEAENCLESNIKKVVQIPGDEVLKVSSSSSNSSSFLNNDDMDFDLRLFNDVNEIETELATSRDFTDLDDDKDTNSNVIGIAKESTKYTLGHHSLQHEKDLPSVFIAKKLGFFDTNAFTNYNLNDINPDRAKFDSGFNFDFDLEREEDRWRGNIQSALSGSATGSTAGSFNFNERKDCEESIVDFDVPTEIPLLKTEDRDKFAEFEAWLLKNGAHFPELHLKTYSSDQDVRGVHCKRFVNAYHTIISIPQKCLITDHMGRTETDLGRKLFSAPDLNLSTPNLIAVVVYILTTRDDANHFFQPYYKILPKTYSNFPIFWDAEKLSWLQGSSLLQDIDERKRNMRSDYDEIVRICPEFSRYGYEEFLEIRTAVGSRNFGIVINCEKRTAMVPYADMLNHYRPRETSWTFENSKDAFTITSLTPLQPGQQVMDSYGKKCNSKFFLHYGFAVERNREEDGKCQNELALDVVLKISEAALSCPNGTSGDKMLFEDRLGVLTSLFHISLRQVANSSSGETGICASKIFRVSMNHDDKATADALAFLRISVSSPEELFALNVPNPSLNTKGYQHCGGPSSAKTIANIRRERHSKVSSEAGFLVTSYDQDSFFSKETSPTALSVNGANGNALANYSFISVRNESAALKQFATLCLKKLESYPQSYTENLMQLGTGLVKPFSDRRTALIVVLGEQEICKFWIYLAKEICPILDAIVLDSTASLHAAIMALKGLSRRADKERDVYRYGLSLAEKLKLLLPHYE